MLNALIRFRKAVSSQLLRSSRQGFTLIEAAMSVAILGVIGLGVGILMMGVVTTQQNQRLRTYQENVAMNLVDAMRRDLRYATSVQASTNGLTIATASGNITYSCSTNDFTRNTVSYLAIVPSNMNLGFDCANLSFDATTNDDQLVMRGLAILDLGTTDRESVIDAAAGGKARFNIPDTTFEIVTNKSLD